jgi:hypothetical protein
VRRSNLSLITAGAVLVLALLWLSLNMPARGMVWVAIGVGWLVTAGFQHWRHDDAEPFPARRLLQRFSRLFLFWS